MLSALHHYSASVLENSALRSALWSCSQVYTIAVIVSCVLHCGFGKVTVFYYLFDGDVSTNKMHNEFLRQCYCKIPSFAIFLTFTSKCYCSIQLCWREKKPHVPTYSAMKLAGSTHASFSITDFSHFGFHFPSWYPQQEKIRKLYHSYSIFQISKTSNSYNFLIFMIQKNHARQIKVFSFDDTESLGDNKCLSRNRRVANSSAFVDATDFCSTVFDSLICNSGMSVNNMTVYQL